MARAVDTDDPDAPDGGADGGAHGTRLPSSGFASRDAIEAYLDRLNRSSPLAQRDITHWGAAELPSLQINAVPLTAIGAPAGDIFLGEARTSFGLDVRARRAAASGAPLSVALVLAGTLQVTLAGGKFAAQAGQGVIVDPAEVERTKFSEQAHFIEFALPRQQLLRLGAELAPAALAGTPGFDTVLPATLAQRLLPMARQTADVLRAERPSPGTRVLFERWLEMLALTLLHEQQAQHAALATDAAAPPRSLRRALDYIDAHVQGDLLLADIAAAACVSASSLLRQFNQHLGQTPHAFVRQVRLDRAHAELRRGAAGSIRELAARWGFQSAGKFSLAYQRRFGEKPSEGRMR